jgi:hypothetical protein
MSVQLGEGTPYHLPQTTTHPFTSVTSNEPNRWQLGWQLLCRIRRYRAISDDHQKRKNSRKKLVFRGFRNVFNSPPTIRTWTE